MAPWNEMCWFQLAQGGHVANTSNRKHQVIQNVAILFLNINLQSARGGSRHFVS